MSGLAGIFNVPATVDERSTWSFVHAAHHRDINRVIFQAVGTELPEFVLDPIDPANSQVWAYQHQVMHQNMNRVLGISGQDLTAVDWTNPLALAGWIFDHAQEHYQAAQVLKIG